MRLALAFALLVPVALSTPALAQQETPDPIDTALSKCLDSPAGESTQGMVECIDKAYRSWDAALNKVYGELMKQLDPKSAALLKASQLKWIAYRDAEKDFFAGPWTADRGTIIAVTLDQAGADIVKDRVLVLRGYLPEEH